MARKSSVRKHVIAFKVDPELATVLCRMPNRSEFIRAAVHASLANACPLCRGTGIAPRDRGGEELTKLVEQHPMLTCLGCGMREPRPCHAPGQCDHDPRIEVVERFGLYYCETCFDALAQCAKCGRPLPKSSKSRRGFCQSCRKATG